VEVDERDGTFSVDGRGGYGRLVDDGDFGDSYNYSPPQGDVVVDTPVAVEAAVVEAGPVRGRILVVATYEWPERIDELSQVRVGSTRTQISTTIELRADEPTVRVETSFTNPARDHRLRVHLPLPDPATTSLAECAFTTVTRGLSAEGRSEEFGLPTYPSRRFVVAGGLSVAHEGLHEFELIDIRDGKAHQIALTLLRSTGMLSRLGMKYRPLPAGPLTPVEGLQMVGQVLTSRYALCAVDRDPYEFADEVLNPLEAFGAVGGGTAPARGSALTVLGAEVSAVHRVAGALEVRVFNPAPTPATVEFPQRRGWLVDLRGRAIEPFEGSFTLRPHGIATIRLFEE
jgi:alpha-mannosidase